jgi:hypothetical protein
VAFSQKRRTAVVYRRGISGGGSAIRAFVLL